MNGLQNIMFAFIGGGIGAVLRLILANQLFNKLHIFPFGTFFVNVTGSFFIGLLFTLFEQKFLINPELKTFLIVGILGGYTTYSSFSYETIILLKNNPQLGIINIAATTIMCLLFTFLGMQLGTKLTN